MSSEVELTMMSSFAQEESISISKNVAVGITHRMMDGTYVYSKVGYGTDYCPAIVSREIFAQANQVMKLRKISSAENRYDGLFKRMVFCSICGESMKRTE